MLPGFSSKNDQIGGGKKVKRSFHGDVDGSNEFNEILLQYNLERMNDQQHDFSHCDTHRDAYPFASSLSKNIDDDSLFDWRHDHDASSYSEEEMDEHNDEDEDEYGSESESIEIRICMYQINTSCYIPFIEYLMVISDEKDGKKKVFQFPKIDYTSSKRKSAEKQAEEHILKTLMHDEDNADDDDDDVNGHVVKFRGIFKPKHIFSGEKKRLSVYFFFQKYFKKTKHPPQLTKRDRAWWVLPSEIANFKKVMYMDIDPDVNELFITNPEIMHLYDCKGRLLETPTVCYFGDEFQKIKYLAFFGLLKAPVKSSFGPFYVATNFLSSMKYACYTHNQQPFELYSGEKITSGEHGKYKEGGVLRMILFIGKMKVFLRDGEPDDSQISQELAKTDKTVEKFLPLRDSNGIWTEEYDTAYKGLHFASINDDVVVNPVEWFFKDYSHSLVISYHNIDTTNIPGKFDVDYADYKLK